MAPLQEDFDELRDRLRSGGTIRNTGDDPVYYLIFGVEEMLEVKRRLMEWTAKLQIDGWTVHRFSMADAIEKIFDESGLKELWLEAESEAPLDFDAINSTLRDALISGDTLKNAMECVLKELKAQPHALLMVTELEALHPYLRVGALEQKLQGRFTVPTVFLYPGKRTGKSTLSFLGIYPEDGNYRSTHIGG